LNPQKPEVRQRAAPITRTSQKKPAISLPISHNQRNETLFSLSHSLFAMFKTHFQISDGIHRSQPHNCPSIHFTELILRKKFHNVSFLPFFPLLMHHHDHSPTSHSGNDPSDPFNTFHSIFTRIDRQVSNVADFATIAPTSPQISLSIRKHQTEIICELSNSETLSLEAFQECNDLREWVSFLQTQISSFTDPNATTLTAFLDSIISTRNQQNALIGLRSEVPDSLRQLIETSDTPTTIRLGHLHSQQSLQLKNRTTMLTELNDRLSQANQQFTAISRLNDELRTQLQESVSTLNQFTSKSSFGILQQAKKLKYSMNEWAKNKPRIQNQIIELETEIKNYQETEKMKTQLSKVLITNEAELMKIQVRYKEELRIINEELGISELSHQTAIQTIQKEVERARSSEIAREKNEMTASLKRMRIAGDRLITKYKRKGLFQWHEVAKEMKKNGIEVFTTGCKIDSEYFRATIENELRNLKELLEAHLSHSTNAFESRLRVLEMESQRALNLLSAKKSRLQIRLIERDIENDGVTGNLATVEGFCEDCERELIGSKENQMLLTDLLIASSPTMAADSAIGEEMMITSGKFVEKGNFIINRFCEWIGKRTEAKDFAVPILPIRSISALRASEREFQDKKPHSTVSRQLSSAHGLQLSLVDASPPSNVCGLRSSSADGLQPSLVDESPSSNVCDLEPSLSVVVGDVEVVSPSISSSHGTSEDLTATPILSGSTSDQFIHISPDEGGLEVSSGESVEIREKTKQSLVKRSPRFGKLNPEIAWNSGNSEVLDTPEFTGELSPNLRWASRPLVVSAANSQNSTPIPKPIETKIRRTKTSSTSNTTKSRFEIESPRNTESGKSIVEISPSLKRNATALSVVGKGMTNQRLSRTHQKNTVKEKSQIPSTVLIEVVQPPENHETIPKVDLEVEKCIQDQNETTGDWETYGEYHPIPIKRLSKKMTQLEKDLTERIGDLNVERIEQRLIKVSAKPTVRSFESDLSRPDSGWRRFKQRRTGNVLSIVSLLPDRH
jgi:hypothetical protein